MVLKTFGWLQIDHERHCQCCFVRGLSTWGANRKIGGFGNGVIVYDKNESFGAS